MVASVHCRQGSIFVDACLDSGHLCCALSQRPCSRTLGSRGFASKTLALQSILRAGVPHRVYQETRLRAHCHEKMTAKYSWTRLLRIASVGTWRRKIANEYRFTGYPHDAARHQQRRPSRVHNNTVSHEMCFHWVISSSVLPRSNSVQPLGPTQSPTMPNDKR